MREFLEETLKNIEGQGLTLDDITTEYGEYEGADTLELFAVIEIKLPSPEDDSQGLWWGGVRLFGYENNFKPTDAADSLEVLAWGLEKPTEPGAEQESPFQENTPDKEGIAVYFYNDATIDLENMAADNVKALQTQAVRINKAWRQVIE